jgi:hypothetical protein
VLNIYGAWLRRVFVEYLDWGVLFDRLVRERKYGDMDGGSGLEVHAKTEEGVGLDTLRDARFSCVLWIGNSLVRR